MKIKFILPSLEEAKSPYWRPIKYSYAGAWKRFEPVYLLIKIF